MIEEIVKRLIKEHELDKKQAQSLKYFSERLDPNGDESYTESILEGVILDFLTCWD